MSRMSIRNLTDTAIRPNPDFEQFRKMLLRQGRTDYVPFYELYVNPGIIEKIVGRKPECAADFVDFYYRAGYDYVPIGIYLPLKKGSLVDSSKGYPISCRSDYEKYHWPMPEDISLEYLHQAAQVLPDGMKIIGQTNGIFENIESLFGYENLCYMLMDDYSLVKELFVRLGELFTFLYTEMAKHKAVGALVISDDMGFRSQTLIAPENLRELVLPWHKKFAEISHVVNKPCILHSCGQLSSIMDDIIDFVKIDAKHSYEDAILPVTEATKLYGDRIAILGGFDIDRLCRSSSDEVRRYTAKLVSECGQNGGYAIGSGNSIADYVPVENYLTMLDQAWKMRLDK